MLSYGAFSLFDALVQLVVNINKSASLKWFH
jgi:hypothetical protein